MSVIYNSHFRILLNGRTETDISGSQQLLSGLSISVQKPITVAHGIIP